MTARRCKGFSPFQGNVALGQARGDLIDAEALALEFDIDDGSTLFKDVLVHLERPVRPHLCLGLRYICDYTSGAVTAIQ